MKQKDGTEICTRGAKKDECSSMYTGDWATYESFETLASVAVSKSVSQAPLDPSVVKVDCKGSRLPWFLFRTISYGLDKSLTKIKTLV